jgi:prevent-host-death family protein
MGNQLDAPRVNAHSHTMVSISQFKAKCLSLIAEVERNKKPILITKNGRIAVKVVPADFGNTSSFFGNSKNQTFIHGDIMSTGESWDAQH